MTLYKISTAIISTDTSLATTATVATVATAATAAALYTLPSFPPHSLSLSLPRADSTGCVDLPGDISGTTWEDSEGDGCDDFEADDDDWCAEYGDSNDNGEGSANDKCCTCGGGSTAGTNGGASLPPSLFFI